MGFAHRNATQICPDWGFRGWILRHHPLCFATKDDSRSGQRFAKGLDVYGANFNPVNQPWSCSADSYIREHCRPPNPCYSRSPGYPDERVFTGRLSARQDHPLREIQDHIQLARYAFAQRSRRIASRSHGKSNCHSAKAFDILLQAARCHKRAV